MKKIELTNGFYAEVSDKDYQLVRGHKWYADKISKVVYAKRNIAIDGRLKKIYMHRVILGLKAGDPSVDHRDGNGLNNMRSNLRIDPHRQNTQNVEKQVNNTSGYKGVSWRKDTKKWHAYIKVKGKRFNLGYHATVVEAAQAYNEAAKKYHGPFARLNNISNVHEG
jgi:hypothetical protein